MADRTRPATPSTTQGFFRRAHDAMIRVYDEAGNVIEAHAHTGDFKEP
jgi:hypothetical protein